MGISTAIAFIVFNRPDTTRDVFAAIRRARPKRLFVISDGPRTDKPGEVELCAATRRVVRDVDWDCDVLTNHADANLGCRGRVSSGLDWVFSIVEEAIILEDDCLPDGSFFAFCEELLARYRGDSRIMHISGTNLNRGELSAESSYYFSKYPLVWGWATWRRAWTLYNFARTTWPAFDAAGEDTYLEKTPQGNLWRRLFRQAFEGEFDMWSLQWFFACCSQSGLSIVPNTNMITNIGFRADATHTTVAEPLFADMAAAAIEFPLKHPEMMAVNRSNDRYFESVSQISTLLSLRRTAKDPEVLTYGQSGS